MNVQNMPLFYKESWYVYNKLKQPLIVFTEGQLDYIYQQAQVW